MKSSEKYKAVQHFKIKPSKCLNDFSLLLSLLAITLLVFSSLSVLFKILISLLIVLECIWQRSNKAKENTLKSIEIRDHKLFFQRKYDERFIEVEKIKLKQNRIFAEIALYSPHVKITELLLTDRFHSSKQLAQLLQFIRFQKQYR